MTVILMALAVVLFLVGVLLPPTFEGYRVRIVAGGLLAWALSIVLSGVR